MCRTSNFIATFVVAVMVTSSALSEDVSPVRSSDTDTSQRLQKLLALVKYQQRFAEKSPTVDSSMIGDNSHQLGSSANMVPESDGNFPYIVSTSDAFSNSNNEQLSDNNKWPVDFVQTFIPTMGKRNELLRKLKKWRASGRNHLEQLINLIESHLGRPLSTGRIMPVRFGIGGRK